MYQVLARKYRPRNFYELVGQQHVSKALTSALERGRLHHAYLFTGTRGVGKTTIARILAKCLNCETGITATPCEQCNVCQAVNEGRFIDLIEIDAASRTKVEDTRELLDNVPYAPTQGRFKVYLIDEVHMLSTHSFNALLKTLEEPPAHVKFLFATTDPQKLPITVISRCLQFTLRPLMVEEIQQHLQKLLHLEQIAYDEPALWQLAESAQGSLRDALSLTDQAIAYGQGQVHQHDVKEMLGLIDRHLVYDLLLAVHQKQRQKVAELLLLFRQQAIDVAMVLEQLISALHELALMQHLPDLTLSYSVEIQQKIRFLASQISAPDIQLYYQICCKGREDLNLAMTQIQGFEMCILRLLAFRPLNANEYVPVSPQIEQKKDITTVQAVEEMAEPRIEHEHFEDIEHVERDIIGEFSDDVANIENDINNNIVDDIVRDIDDNIENAESSILNQGENIEYNIIDEIVVEHHHDILEYHEKQQNLADYRQISHFVCFENEILVDVLQGGGIPCITEKNPEQLLSGYLYFTEQQDLFDFADISEMPEILVQYFKNDSLFNTENMSVQMADELEYIVPENEILNSVADDIENVNVEHIPQNMTEYSVNEMPVEEKNMISENHILEDTIQENNVPESHLQENHIQENNIPKNNIPEENQRSPQEILALPVQELTGVWTAEKWEYCLRNSGLSPMIQGILQNAIMQGEIGVENQLFLQQDYAHIFQQFEIEVQQYLFEWQQGVFNLNYVPTLPENIATPLQLEQQRFAQAQQQAHLWLHKTPAIAQLLEAFSGQIESIDLGVKS